MSVQPQQNPRIGTLIRQDAEEALLEANVSAGSTVMETKKDPGTIDIGHGGKLATNMYRLEMRNKQTVFRYEVSIFGVLGDLDQIGTQKLVNITMRSPSDYRVSNFRFMCVAVYKAFKQKYVNTYLQGNQLYYDAQRILYALYDLNLGESEFEDEFSLEEVARFAASTEDWFKAYKLKIALVKDEKQLVFLGDLSHISADSAKINRSQEQFLDIATSQEAFDDPKNFLHYSSSSIYLLDPASYGFADEDCPYFSSNSSFLGIGLGKGIRPIEKPIGEPLPYPSEGLIVSVKKTCFHVDELVSDKLIALVGSKNMARLSDTEWLKERFEHELKGLYVAAAHRERIRVFQIHGLSATNVKTEMIPVEGDKQISIFEYYTKRYNVDFQYPGFPLLIHKIARSGGSGNTLFYPMEVCSILDNQRVKTDQQHPQAIREMIRKTALPPALLKKQDACLKEALKLDSSSAMAKAGVRCQQQPMQVSARVLPPPDLEFFARIKQTPKQPSNTWMDGAHYFMPTTCNKWAAIALYGSDQDALHLEEWITFLDRYCLGLTNKGMQFVKPHVDHIQIQNVEVKGLIQRFFENGFEFMLIAHPDSADEVHHSMKFYEQRTEVVTQGVKITTVKNILAKNQVATLSNIIHKTNVKLGGLNYTISLPESELSSIFGNETLIIGFGANHPSGGIGLPGSTTNNGKNGNNSGNGTNGNNASGNGTNGNGPAINGGNIRKAMNTIPSNLDGGPPSVVGFSANVGRNSPFEFIGDFVFQAAFRDEKVRIISNIVKRCATQFKVVNGQFPRRVIIYRNGCAEGAFQKILEFEVPLSRKALLDIGCPAKITVIVANKLQELRFYANDINPSAKSPEQNILPGTVVDTGVVHPLWNEFFLNSHVALQGTAKTPRFTILIDENKFSMDALESMTHSLCFAHQIVYSPTSLPTPVFVALEYAKRGRNIFNYWIFSGSGVSPEGELRDFAKMTEHLSYENTAYLSKLRLNA